MTATVRPRTTLQLLGPVGARRGDEPLRVGGPRQRTLLALLAIRGGRWISTDILIEEVFGGQPTDAAETTLRSYVSRLRSALGEEVSIRGGPDGYLLEAAPDAVDAVLFGSLVTEADRALAGRRHGVAVERLRAALDLWRGEPFGGLGTDGILRMEAERLAELQLHALESRIEADLALGTAGSLVEELELLVREHPFREAFWRQLMLALYRSERQADALAAYHRARAALDEHLGIEPGEELVALEAAILRHDVPDVAPPTVRHNLPVSVTSFVGRDLELSRIEALVGSNRLVTLTGVGGVGKTRLAIEAARGLASSFADGVAFVDLAPLADDSLVADQMTTVLGISSNTNLSPVDRLLAHLRDRELLLVVDNCEHLLAATASIAARLLAGCPSLRVLATSREVLGVDGEADAPVPPLGISSEGDPGGRDAEAIQLFMARARAARPGLPDDDATIATVRSICADLDGIPLAIELAAARARVLSPAEIHERLRDRFRFLVSWRRLGTARHRTLREAMDWSHDLLDPSGQQLLAELSVFAGGFGLEAVAAVCSVTPSSDVLDQVQRLVEASLVTVDQGTAPTRYSVLETVREYGAGRLEAAGRTDELRRRHAESFAVLAGEAWEPIRASATQEAWLARLRVDRDNFRAALGWSLEHDEPAIAMRITDTLWWSWWFRGESAEGRSWMERALAADHREDLWRRARCCNGLAGLCWSLGDYDAAELHGQEALRLAKDVGDNIVAARAANTLGVIAIGRSEPAKAYDLFTEAVARNRMADMPEAVRDWSLGIAIDNLGTAAHDLGNDEVALRHLTEAREINVRLGNRGNIAMNDLHLSILEAEGGSAHEARRRLHDAFSVYEEIGFLHYATECFEAAALVANQVGAPAEAAYALGAAAHVHGELTNRPVGFMVRLRDREAAAARAALGDEAFEAAYAAGLGVPVEAAIRHTIEFLGA